MCFRNLFSSNRSLYQKLFSYNYENDYDEVIVHPNQLYYDSTSSIPNINNFQPAENIVDIIESPYINSLLKQTNKVLVLKVKTPSVPNSIDLSELNKICSGNSTVIFLAVDQRRKFHLYWKSKQIKYFLTFKPYDNSDFLNDIRLYEFLANFLGNALKQGHLGLHSEVPIRPAVNTIALHLLADHRNYNLLLVAANDGDAYIVKLMLHLGFNSDFREINAQTLAWNNRHFEVLSLFLKSNLIYPYSIDIDECPEDIQEFFEISRGLNEAILVKDGDKVLRIITQNKDMTHFYNLNNESALAFALNRRFFDMYRLLISKNVILGPHENFSEIKEDMKKNEREKLREIHFKESKTLPDNHMHVLMSNSRLGHDSINVQEKFQKIQNAFEILNGNPFIQILLKIVAASRNFRIIFDFNRDSIEVVDPTVDDSTDGLFYLSGRIYIAAKKLLDNNMKFEALGVLAHELCHYTMVLVYKNKAKPYFANDSKTKKLFGEICNFCVENAGKEKLIDNVQKYYEESTFHAELIVRVPNLIMVYLNNPEQFNAVRSTFHSLFDIYEEKIFKEMKEALPKVEAKAEAEKEKNLRKIRKMKIRFRISIVLCLLGASIGIFVTGWFFYKPIYKFSTLSPVDQIKVENAPVIYKHVDIVFCDLFPRRSPVYDLLTSDDISQMLNGNALDFNNPHLSYLDDLVVLKWRNLTTKLKDKFLTSNFTFQSETLRFDMMNISTTNGAFNSLKSEQIIDVLDGKTLAIHRMIKNETAFYIERSVFTEFIYVIYYKYMIKINGDKTQFDCFYLNNTGTANFTFENFYENITNLSFDDMMSAIVISTQYDNYLRCFVSGFKVYDPKTRKAVDTLLSHKTLQKEFDEILLESGLKSNNNTSRTFILSADAGAGKTETFRQFALRIKKMYPTWWVSYIDCRQHKDLFKNIYSLNKAKKALAQILEIYWKNEFEHAIYEELFASGRMILLWDGFDQIFPNWKNANSSTNILKYIQENSTNIQFMSTRPSGSTILRKVFLLEPYTFVPLDMHSQKEFLDRFFKSQNKTELEIPKYTEKVQKIVNSTKSKNDFNTPFLLGMISLIISNNTEIFESENLYNIYERFVEIKLHLWLSNKNNDIELIESLVTNKISIFEIYQHYAFKIIPDNNIGSFYRFLSLYLKINAVDYSSKFEIDQISEMGILYINRKRSYSFAHLTFVEFFIAQYIIHNLFISENNICDGEAEFKIQLFYWSIQDRGISIFIDSYLQTASHKNDSFNERIGGFFMDNYRNFTLNMMQNRPLLVPLMINVFKKNQTILETQLQLDDDSVYASTFDNANFNCLTYVDINRTAILGSAQKNLNDDDYRRFTSLKDHKGIILYTMYCVKQFKNSSEYARESFPGYDLPDEIFESYNVSNVLMWISKNITKEELKKLLTSETVWNKLNIRNESSDVVYFVDNNLEFYKTLLHLMEANFKNDKKSWILKILKFPFLLETEATRMFLISEISNILTKSEIFDGFSSSNILHYTASIGSTYASKRFEDSWKFLYDNTNETQRRHILQRSRIVKCYLNHKHTNFCHLVPKINILQSSLIGGFIHTKSNISNTFQKILQHYKLFNNSELQEIIMNGSKEFVPFLIMARSPDECNVYADFLKDLFKDNKKLLEKLLIDPDKPNTVSFFKLIKNNHYAEENFKIFNRLLKSIKEKAAQN